MRIASLLYCVALSASAWAADPFLGSWKLIPEKSKFVPGPAMQSMTMNWSEESEKSFRIRSSGLTADGKQMRESYTAIYDGVERKKPGSTVFDAVIFRKVSDNQREDIFKKEGAVIGSRKLVLSADGKVLTDTWRVGELQDVRVLEKE